VNFATGGLYDDDTLSTVLPGATALGFLSLQAAKVKYNGWAKKQNGSPDGSGLPQSNV